MNKVIFLSLVLFSVSNLFATCEDGEGLASDAAIAHVVKKYSYSKKSCKAYPYEEENDRYAVNVKCKNGYLYFYQVQLKEVEDAYCFVKSVKLVGSNN